MKLIDKFKNLSQNNQIVFKNTLFSFIIKGAALFVSLFTTPAYIKYFNNNSVLGVWYTILSVLMWFLNFDLGIGNGIRNKLVKDLTANDRDSAKNTISSGMFANVIITLILAVVGVVLVKLIDLNWLFNTSSDVIAYETLLYSTLLVLGAILLRFFLTTISSIIYALQKSALNDFLTLTISVLLLAFVLIFKFETMHQKLVYMSLAYLILSNLPLAIAGIVIFMTTLKDCKPTIKCISKENVKGVLSIGTIFFICQIPYMLIVNSNEFLITLRYGPEFTTEYSFYYKITSLISLVIIMAMTPIWSVITKALAEGNYTWLFKLFKVLTLVGFGAVAIQFLFIPFQQFVMNIWLRENSIKVEISKAFAFACFGGVFVYSTILSTIVCGMAKMKLQTICYGIGVVLKFLIIFLPFATSFNWTLVVWCNVGVLLPYCILEHIALHRYFTKMKDKQIKGE